MFAVDCHAHIYHPKLAPRAVKGVGAFYEVPMSGSGTTEDLIRLASHSPVKRFVVNSVAMNAKSVRKLNEFVASECQLHPELIGLGTLHPDLEDPEEEIRHILSLGLRGIKLHPDTQQFDADSDKAMALYAAIEGRLPLLIHCGDYRYDTSHPRRIANILDTFPKLTMIAAHLGGWSIYEQAVPYMKDRNCYLDLSSVMPFMEPEKVLSYIRLYGADRLLFGSDYPMWDPLKEYQAFLTLPLTREVQELIFYRNAAKLFSVDLHECEAPSDSENTSRE